MRLGRILALWLAIVPDRPDRYSSVVACCHTGSSDRYGRLINVG
jgi:hypothetical protein